jgi:hypothetical protein
MLAESYAEGAELPNDPELETDLMAPQCGFSSKQQIPLEKKEDVKGRGLASPDLGDCLTMSFAVRLLAKTRPPSPPEPPRKFGPFVASARCRSRSPSRSCT